MVFNQKIKMAKHEKIYISFRIVYIFLLFYWLTAVNRDKYQFWARNLEFLECS